MTHILASAPPSLIRVKRALLSVSDKTGIVDFARALHGYGVDLLSTGGTATALQEAGIPVRDVSAHTGFPEMMDGRVKTLHPKIHGGILSVRDNPQHRAAQEEHGVGDIDMVVVNLYPFVKTVEAGADYAECIENIDIGGPAMVRSAAKNHAYVSVITSSQDYAAVLEELSTQDVCTSYALRQRLAARAYAHTASYDTAIAAWFSKQLSQGTDFAESFFLSGQRQQTLRYGENPHQKAALYLAHPTQAGVATASLLQGKELSYNNLSDTDAAYALVCEFEEPAVAIIKHANPCGIALADTMLEAYSRALACDPVSAFGGIIALNRPLDAQTAQKITEIFSEVIIAPKIAPEALPVLAKKKNVRVLETGGLFPPSQATGMIVKQISGGFLVQDADCESVTREHLRVVTKRSPTEQEIKDMLFAFKVAKHVKSNAIVYALNGITTGIGAGQMNRLDSSRIAAMRMREYGLAPKEGDSMVVASDAFFPFPDGLLAAADAGVTAVIQPGGSLKDADVIAAADERGLAMVFTGIRHFRH